MAQLIELRISLQRQFMVVRKNLLRCLFKEMKRGNNLLKRHATFGEESAEPAHVLCVTIHIFF